MEHLAAFGRVLHLGMELHGIKAKVGLFHRRDRTGVRAAGYPETGWDGVDMIGMAHPADRIFLHRGKQQAVRLQANRHAAVLTLFRGHDMAAEHFGHQLRAVADAEDRQAQLENSRVAARRGGSEDAVRAAGKDDAPVLAGNDPFHGRGIGQDFAVDMVVADPAGDQLVILAAKIKNQNRFMLHSLCSSKLNERLIDLSGK